MKEAKTFEVRGKSFRLDFVSNWFQVTYYAMKQDIIKAQEAYYAISLAADRVRDRTIDVKVAEKVVIDNKAIIESIGTREFFDRRLDLVREALESNEVEYDKRWWERRTSPEDLVKFLDEVYLYGNMGELDEETEGASSKKGRNVKK